MHSAPNSDSCGDKVPSLNPFAPTFFFILFYVEEFSALLFLS